MFSQDGAEPRAGVTVITRRISATLLPPVMVFAIYHHESAMGVHVSPTLNLVPPPPHPIPLGYPRAPALSTLFHASIFLWSSVFNMVINIFQCYSLISSHPHLLPQSPKVCSLYPCLFCCLAYRIIVTIFLTFIYMC